MFFLELFLVAIVDTNIPLVLCNTVCGQKYSWISEGKHDLWSLLLLAMQYRLWVAIDINI